MQFSGRITENTPISIGEPATLNLRSLYFEKKVQQLKMVLKRDMDNRENASNPKVTGVFSPGERRDRIRKADSH